MDKGSPLILIVDDIQENLDVLVEILAPYYRLKVAKSGERALHLCLQELPQLILLDVMMPGMSGFEVCEALKASSDTSGVPVIFISAADDAESKVQAFRLGGVDYVNKPFQAEELKARIHTHLSLNDLQLQLQKHNENLDLLVQQKSCELVHAYERLALMDQSKSEFLELLAHEIRTPANGIIGLAELMADCAEPSPELMELQNLFAHSKARMLETIDTALLLARTHVADEKFSVVSLALGTFLRQNFPDFAESFWDLIVEDLYVLGNEEFFVRAFTILFDLASVFSINGKIEVHSRVHEAFVEIFFAGAGRVVDEKYRESFFDIYRSSRSMTYAAPLGLAPALAQKIFSFYGGRLTLENKHDASGVVVVLCLPVMN